jgi:hypothetical protein
MVRFLSIWLLIAYGVALLQPYLPFVDYQLRMDYYVEVLCENRDRPELHCDGKCALAQKLQAAMAESLPEAPQAPNSLQASDFLSQHLGAAVHFSGLKTEPLFPHHQLLAWVSWQALPDSPPPRWLA